MNVKTDKKKRLDNCSHQIFFFFKCRYIFVITLEDKRVHITASSRGFYVNQTTEEVFNPKPVAQAHLSHSLVDLLSQIR